MMKKGKYLITGCAGFVGSNLVKKISMYWIVSILSTGSNANPISNYIITYVMYIII